MPSPCFVWMICTSTASRSKTVSVKPPFCVCPQQRNAFLLPIRSENVRRGAHVACDRAYRRSRRQNKIHHRERHQDEDSAGRPVSVVSFALAATQPIHFPFPLARRKVHILGSFQNIKIARDAVVRLVMGTWCVCVCECIGEFILLGLLVGTHG